MKKVNKSFSIVLAVATASLFLYSCSKETLDTMSTPDSNVVNPATTTQVTTTQATPSLKTANGDVQMSSVILYAGQSMNAGSVTLSQTDTDGDLTYDAVKVTYTLTGDWTFNTLVHFYIGEGPAPTNKNGNMAPGQFPYIYTAGTNPFSFTVPFSALGFDCEPLKLNVAAHAELLSPTFGGQTGFGDGIATGSNWFMQYNVTLSDKTAPKASDVTSTVECIGSVPAPNASVITDASDNCSLATVPVAYVEGSETKEGSCPTIVTRTYLVSDAAGNTTTVTETITVHDLTKPVLAGQGADIALACGLDFTVPTASDNCDATPVITFTDVVVGNTTTRTWIATDACGNVSDAVSQSITLDKTSPVLTLVGDPILTIGCSVAPVFTIPLATDNNTAVAPTVTVSGTDLVETTVTGDTWTTRTWTATDACGNSSTISQKIINNCTFDTKDLYGWLPGAGTGWAYDDNGTSTAFNSLSPKTGNNWGWTNLLTYGTTSKDYTLYVGAGQNIITKGVPAGGVTVTVGANIVVTYTVVSSCKITEAHLYVGTTPLPLNKQKSYVSSPGQLGNNSGALNTNTYTFTVPNKFGTKNIYVAAHAVVDVR